MNKRFIIKNIYGSYLVCDNGIVNHSFNSDMNIATHYYNEEDAERVVGILLSNGIGLKYEIVKVYIK